MTETKYFRDAFRDQLHELSRQPNISYVAISPVIYDFMIQRQSSMNS